MSGRPRGRLVAATMLALCVLATGCGTTEVEPSAADQVPGLEEVLQRVDTALATHRFAAARQQLKALKAFIDDQAARFNVPKSRIYGHRDIKPTICPGDHLYAWLQVYTGRR